MTALIWFILEGLLIGVLNGITPGPLFVLVVRETVRGGWRAGLPLAFVPICTDIPVLLLSLFLSSRLGETTLVISSIGLIGACVLLWMAFETARAPPHIDMQPRGRRPVFVQGLVTNFTNPHVYLFYFVVGSALFLRARAESTLALVLFIASFLAALVTSKICLVFVAHHTRGHFTGKRYVWLLRVLAAALALFAVQIGWDSVTRLLG